MTHSVTFVIANGSKSGSYGPIFASNLASVSAHIHQFYIRILDLGDLRLPVLMFFFVPFLLLLLDFSISYRLSPLSRSSSLLRAFDERCSFPSWPPLLWRHEEWARTAVFLWIASIVLCCSSIFVALGVWPMLVVVVRKFWVQVSLTFFEKSFFSASHCCPTFFDVLIILHWWSSFFVYKINIPIYWSTREK